MRRLEYQVTQVRNSTDNKDVNGISTAEIVGYFNDAQKYITTLIFKNNPYADMFKSQVIYPSSSSGEYTIPSDCYSTSSISMVEGRFGETEVNGGYRRIKPISESELAYSFGYTVRNNKVIISGQNNVAQIQSIRVTYFKRLQTVDVRQARIQSKTSTTLVLDAAPPGLYTMDDKFSVVDDQGIQSAAGLYTTTTSGSTLAVPAGTANVDLSTVKYVVSGENANNKCELPDECEPYLLDYVKQRIYTRNNYSDADKQLYFTEQQKAEIISIFSKNKKDDDTIPTTDLEFLLF
jgi:hypothetical protein